MVTVALQAATGLIGAIPQVNQDDVIGAFEVHLRNVNSKLETVWLPWLKCQFPSGREGATTIVGQNSFYAASLEAGGHKAVSFQFKATQEGQYRGVVTARLVDAFVDEQYEFLGTEVDRCGAPILFVSDRNRGVVQVGQAQSNVAVDVPNNRFYWYCGTSQRSNDDKDWTTAPTATDRVLVSRGADRRILWRCYRYIFTNLTNIAVRGLSIQQTAPQPQSIEIVGFQGQEKFTWVAPDARTRWPFQQVKFQDGWKWCHKCAGLWFEPNANSKCPTGGTHDDTGSGHYAIAHFNQATAALPTGLQGSWRHCGKCQGLWNTDWFGNSVCPGGGSHSTAGSGYYALIFMNPNLGSGNGSLQGNWHWCQKCWGLWFAGNGLGRCPAGGGHQPPGGGLDYEILHRHS